MKYHRGKYGKFLKEPEFTRKNLISVGFNIIRGGGDIRQDRFQKMKEKNSNQISFEWVGYAFFLFLVLHWILWCICCQKTRFVFCLFLQEGGWVCSAPQIKERILLLFGTVPILSITNVWIIPEPRQYKRRQPHSLRPRWLYKSPTEGYFMNWRVS